MKTLQEYIEEKLLINKNFKGGTIEERVEDAINNYTYKFNFDSKSIIQFPDADSFLKCLDELNIKYTTDKNKKYDEVDILWIEFKNTFVYQRNNLSASIVCKYIRIAEAFGAQSDIVIKIGTVSKSNWNNIQGIQRSHDKIVGMDAYEIEQMKNILAQLVEAEKTKY